MGAALDDAAMVENHDAIGVHDRAQTVGDHEGGAALHQGVHAVLHQLFRAGVDGGSCLVQNHDGRIGHGRTGNGDQLPLTLGQTGAVAREHGVVAIGQAGDEVVGVCQLRRVDALFVSGIQLAVANVVHHRAGEQVGVL